MIHRLKLGRSRLKYDRRTLLAERYLASVPAPPARKTWDAGIADWPMFSNDAVGDCTIAGIDRLIEVQSKNSAGTAKIISDADTLAAYSAISGYVADHPETDIGATCLDALNYWRHTGIGGDRLYAYAAVPPTSPLRVRQAIWLFGGIYVGLDLPLTAMPQTKPGGVWRPTGRGLRATPGSWGGHACAILGFWPRGLIVVPWGSPDVGRMTMTWPFLTKYCSEAYACLSTIDWAENALAPCGFALQALKSDLAKISAR